MSTVPNSKTEELLRGLLLGHLVMLINIGGLPWITDPYISHSPRCAVSVFIHQVLGKLALLLLVLVLFYY